GYHIKQLITVPDLEHYKWLDNFIVQTEEAEQTFETSLAGCPVKLEVVVTTHVRDLQGITDYLNRRLSVPALMKEAVFRITEQYMHTVAPERFYMRFSHIADDEHRDETPVQDELSAKITKALEKPFNAEVIAVTLKVGQTPLTERWSALRKRFCDFTVTVSSRDPLTAEDIVIKGTFRVESLDYKGWENFLNRAHSLDDISNRLTAIIRSELDLQATDVLAFRDVDSLGRLARIIVPSAEKRILDEFGLCIRIDTFIRERTEIEDSIQEATLRNLTSAIETEADVTISRREAFAEAKKKLYDDLSKLIATGDIEESNRMLESIKKLDSLLPDNGVLGDVPLKRLTKPNSGALPGHQETSHRLIAEEASDNEAALGDHSDRRSAQSKN
ncbi:MAG: hypothetical protein ACREDR_02710, partial [Blastocatellia bacterium]